MAANCEQTNRNLPTQPLHLKDTCFQQNKAPKTDYDSKLQLLSQPGSILLIVGAQPSANVGNGYTTHGGSYLLSANLEVI